MVLAISGLMVAAGGPSAHAAPGALDPSFSGDGRVALVSSDSFVAKAVAIDKENRIVVAGYSCDGASDATCLFTGDSNFRLARLTRSGDLDYEFGKAGFVQGPIGDGRSQAFDVIQNGDGTILAGGVAKRGGRDVFALVKYLSNGALDQSFGTGGIVLQPVGSSSAELLALHPSLDGSILAAGQATDGEGVPRMAVVHFLANGNLDTGFGTGGYTLGGEAAYNFATSLAVNPSTGSITAAGISGPSSTQTYYGVGEMRLDRSGHLVSSFGGDGSAGQRPGSYQSFALTVIPAPGDGFLVAGGAALPSGGAQVLLIRGTKAGVPDPSFGADGIGLYPQLTGQVNDLIPFPGRRTLTIGQLFANGRYSFGQTRILPNGQVDTTWGSGGTRRISFEGIASARATAGTLTAGGRIVTVGVGCVGGDATKATCDGGREVLLASRQIGAGSRDTTSPHMSVSLPTQVSARRLHHRGIPLRVTLSEPARVEIVAWRANKRIAHVARAGLARNVSARLHATTHAGVVHVRVRAVDRAGNATSRPFTLHVT